jgi:hypothetical protein
MVTEIHPANGMLFFSCCDDATLKLHSPIFCGAEGNHFPKQVLGTAPLTIGGDLIMKLSGCAPSAEVKEKANEK